MENIEMKFATVTPHGIVIPDVIDKRTSKKYINWGEDNKLPNYLWDNYLSCSNLQSIVNTISDFVIGEGVEDNFTQKEFNDNIQKWVIDYILFGGFAVECIRNKAGVIVQANYVNVMNVRVDEELTTAYLCNNWGSWSGKNIIELPLYDDKEKQPHFIYYFRGNITRHINPVPMYIASLKSIEILNNVKNFHLNNLTNGFTASTLINLNDGNIKTKELKEIKQQLEEKFTGSSNAGKFILINGGDKDHEATVARLDADNFGDLYKALAESSVNDLYVAFRINPMLVGVNVQTGFSKEEFENAFALYNSTVITPIKNIFIKHFEKLGITISFKNFKINWA
jgi:hypothetical protein